VNKLVHDLPVQKVGADGEARSNEEKTAFDYAKSNESLKGTDALKELQEASK
jgi:hypothetical protein